MCIAELGLLANDIERSFVILGATACFDPLPGRKLRQHAAHTQRSAVADRLSLLNSLDEALRSQ